MNSEFYELIGKAIDCLSTAKTDIVNRKSLILEAINNIKHIINKLGDNHSPITLPIMPASVNLTNNNMYTIELERFGISNDGTNATDTTIGINNATAYAQENGYDGVIFPEGTYLIDGAKVYDSVIIPDADGVTGWDWRYDRKGVIARSNMIYDLTGATLQIEPSATPYISPLVIGCVENFKLLNGTIIGDRLTHKYGTMINMNGGELEPGGIDDNGNPVDRRSDLNANDAQSVRTKNFIEQFEYSDGTIGAFPSRFHVVPVLNTRFNITDGGRCFVYFYDENGNFISRAGGDGWGGYCSFLDVPEGAKKLKIEFYWEEGYLDGIYALSTESIYPTYEYNAGIILCNTSRIEIDGTEVKECVGDAIYTLPTPTKSDTSDTTIINCNLHHCRRQGISFVGDGSRYLIKDCEIHHIQGVDPQSGIDIEHHHNANNYTLDNINFHDNRKMDFINFNGEIVEMKNCSISNIVGANSGGTMSIHDNNFIIPEKIRYVESFLPTKNNRIYNNYFEGAYVGFHGENSYAYNNIFGKDTRIHLYTNDKNTFNECNAVRLMGDDLIYDDLVLNNCKHFTVGTPKDILLNNFTFNNTPIDSECGTLTVKNSTFNMKTMNMIDDHWRNTERKIIFDNCTVNADVPIIQNGGKVNWEFKNCDITVIRESFLNYGTTIYENCTINLIGGNPLETVFWNHGDNQILNNCIITSEYPTRIHNTGEGTNILGNNVTY